MAVERAIQFNVIMADKPITWLRGFINAVERWKPEWAAIYGAQYAKEVKDGTLSFRKVTANFKEALNKDTSIRRGTVAKGAFGPMFDGEGSEKAKTERSKSNPPKKRSRPVSI